MAVEGPWSAAPGAPAGSVRTGSETYKSFYFFNSMMVSRLSSAYPVEDLAFARGVCLNLAMAHHMEAGPGALVYAETLAAGPADAEGLAALRTAREAPPVCSVQYMRRDGPKQTALVYAAGSELARLGARYVMFSQHDPPVVVGLLAQPALPAGPAEYSRFRVAVREMLSLHGLSSTISPLRPCRHALKNASFAKNEAGLSAEQRAQLFRLSRDDSPGVYAMACEFGEC